MMKKLFFLLFILFSACVEGAKLEKVTPVTTTVGSIITIVGSGFLPEEPLRVDFDGYIEQARGNADKEGNFIIEARVPNFPYGICTFFVLGLASYRFVSGTINIVANIEDISPHRASVGEIIKVQATGFGTEETVLVSFDTFPTVSYQISDRNGNIFITSAVPPLPGGKRVLRLKGVVSDQEITGNFYIIPSIVRITPQVLKVNSTVSIEGQGYLPQETIEIDFSDRKSIVTAVATEEGVLNASFLVETQPFGRKTLTIRGKEKEIVQELDLIGDIIVFPTSGKIGERIDITGLGFGKEEIIQVGLGKFYNIGMTKADKEGSFFITVSSPPQPGGILQLAVYGISTYLTERMDYTLLPSIYIEPTHISVGKEIKLRGEGYFASDTLAVDFGKLTTYTTISTDSEGCFSYILLCPEVEFGTHRVYVRSIANPAWISEVEVSVIPSFYSSVPSGGVGDRIELEGKGWVQEEPIKISFSNYLPEIKLIADSQGIFKTDFIVVTLPQSILKISAFGAISKVEREIAFEIKPKINYVSKREVKPGDTVCILVTGFFPKEPVEIMLVARRIKVIDATELGIVTTEFKIPEDIREGEVNLIVRGYYTPTILSLPLLITK